MLVVLRGLLKAFRADYMGAHGHGWSSRGHFELWLEERAEALGLWVVSMVGGAMTRSLGLAQLGG